MLRAPVLLSEALLVCVSSARAEPFRQKQGVREGPLAELVLSPRFLLSREQLLTAEC